MNNVVLSGLQNLLGRVITIQNVYRQITQWTIEEKWQDVYISYGKLWQMLIDF